jgi:MarR family transcriptional regulator, negative regulator of the multidrug operon emrRAB
MSRLRTANLLGALAGEVANRLDRQLKSHPNQTNSFAAALNIIAYYEGCTNARLARALHLSHTAAVRLVDKLEAQGLVESRDSEDGRAVALYLTGAGKAQARMILEGRRVTLAGLIDVLSGKEQDQFARCLEKILTSLTETSDHADYICRLCDDIGCTPEQCPVHLAAIHHSTEARS